MGLKLSDEQRKFYFDNGYLLLKNSVPSQIVDRIRDEVNALATPEWTPIQSPHKSSPAVKEYITSHYFLDPVTSLKNKRKIPITSTLVFAKPNNPYENGSVPHQDWNGGKAPEENYMIIGLAIDGADETNGGMMLYPGSHKCGILPFEDRSAFEAHKADSNQPMLPLGRPSIVPAGLEKKKLKYDSGDLIFLHSLMLHHCDKNEHPTLWRRHLYIEIIEDGDPFWPGWRTRRELIE